MANALEFDGKIFYSVKDAAQHVSYSRDYVTRLAREKKIAAHNVGRQWFVDVDSLKDYSSLATAEQEIRKQVLSEERKREREVRDAVQLKRDAREKEARTLHVRSVATASLVLMLGLVFGWGTYQMSQSITNSQPQHTQVAQVPAIDTTNSKQLAQDLREEEDVVLPSREVDSLGDADHGILLFPTGEVSASTTDLFSDDVEIREKEDGTKVVVKVDDTGRVIGNEVPMVDVRVNLIDQ